MIQGGSQEPTDLAPSHPAGLRFARSAAENGAAAAGEGGDGRGLGVGSRRGADRRRRELGFGRGSKETSQKPYPFFFPSLSLPFFSSPTMYTAEYTAPFSCGKMEARHVSHVRPPTPFSKSDQLSSATCQEWRYRRL